MASFGGDGGQTAFICGELTTTLQTVVNYNDPYNKTGSNWPLRACDVTAQSGGAETADGSLIIDS